MRQDLYEKVVHRQDKHGGHGADLTDHALKVLEETIELCIASGATANSISLLVTSEIGKAAHKKELTGQFNNEKTAEELADVSICLSAMAYHAGIDIDLAVEHKLVVLRGREWGVSPSGVLRRSDRISLIHAVPFTHYIRPNGRTISNYFETIRSDVYTKSMELLATEKYRFEVEILTTGEVSATIHNINSEQDVAIAVNPKTAEDIERMIMEFDPKEDKSEEEM